jgi:hypothetical protein
LAFQNILQHITTSAVRLYKGDITLNRLAFCGPRHIMRNRIGKKDYQVRTPNALG